MVKMEVCFYSQQLHSKNIQMKCEWFVDQRVKHKKIDYLADPGLCLLQN